VSWRRRALGALAPLLLALPLAAGENRHWVARFALEGPLDELVLDAGPYGTTRLVLRPALLPGERREARLPLPWRAPLGGASLPADPELRIERRPADAGEARFLGWVAPQPSAALEALPPGLASRPRPPLGPGSARAPGLATSALLLLLAALLLGRGLRGRGAGSAGPARAREIRSNASAVLVGLLVGGLLFFLGRRPAPPGAAVEVVEGDLARDAWLSVRSGRERLAGPFARLELEPAGRALAFELAGEEGGEPRASAVAPGSVLSDLERLPTPADTTLDRPPCGALDEVWLRAADGRWARLGAWPADAPAPAGEERAQPQLPGWLVTGLPPGTGVLVGRLADGGEGRWMRVTGVPPRAAWGGGNRSEND